MKISPKQYAQTLYELTDGKSKSEIEKSVADFAGFLQRSGKLKISDKILDHFSNIFNQKQGIVEAEVMSRKKIDASELKEIEKYIRERYGAKEIVIENTVDEKIQGGIILKIGDEVIDGSVKGKLEELKKLLSN